MEDLGTNKMGVFQNMSFISKIDDINNLNHESFPLTDDFTHENINFDSTDDTKELIYL
jgi:hypothetical protein